MTSKQPPATPAGASFPGGSAGGTAGGTAAATIANPSDPAALLLNILRSVDREVRSSLELDDNALEVVRRFRAIDRALRVRPVAVPTASGITPRAAGVPATGAAAASATAKP